LAGGLFDIQTDQYLYGLYNEEIFNNAGTVRKSAGLGTTLFQRIAFQNTGIVDVEHGRLGLPGTYSQAGGTLEFGVNAAADFGTLQFSGVAPLDGTLEVRLNNGFVPALGASFALISYPSYTGGFTVFVLPTAAVWQTNYSATAFSIVATTITGTPTNQPPVANAGPNQIVEQTSPSGTPVVLNGSASTDDGLLRPLTYTWSTNNVVIGNEAILTKFFPWGTNVATLSVFDGQYSNSASVTIIVQDTTAPRVQISSGPAEGSFTNSRSVTVGWIGTDNGTYPSNLLFSFSLDGRAASPFLNQFSNTFSGLADGAHKVSVLAKDERGNISSTPALLDFLVETTPPADLLVPKVNSPAHAQAGQTIEVSWIVQNNGGSIAAPAWSDRMVLSTNPAGLAGAQILLPTVPSPVPQLAPGASYTNTQTVTLPNAAAIHPGVYYLVVDVDYLNQVIETTKTNNVAASALTITSTPLPDLAVSQITAPPTILPGQLTTLSWVVTNQGNLLATGPWSESVYLTSVAGAAFDPTQPGTLVATFQYTNNVAAGDSLSRTQTFVLPSLNLSGNSYFAVGVDSANNVVESNETNNVFEATNASVVLPFVTVVLPVKQVVESPATSILSGSVQRNGDLSQPLTVTIQNSTPTQLSVPPTVTIPAGQSTLALPVTVLDDGIVNDSQTVTITPIAAGYNSTAAQLYVINGDNPQLTLSLSSYNFPEGNTVIATLGRNYSDTNAVSVQIHTLYAGVIYSSITAILPPGGGPTNFLITSVDDGVITPPKTFTVAAAANGYLPASVNFTTTEIDTPVVTLSLSTTNISKGDGSQAAFGTAHRSPTTASPLQVLLQSTNIGAAVVPASVTIPAGSDSASFPVGAVQDGQVTGLQETLIRCFLTDSTGAVVGEADPVLLFVQDDNGPALKVSLALKTVAEGLTPATTATVTRNTGTSGDLLVSLASSVTSAATVPGNVVIPDGTNAVTVSINSINDGVTHGNQNVFISASSTNYATGSDTLTVSDINLPDLAVPSVIVPAIGIAGTYTNISYRVVNQGLADAGSNFTDRVSFSTDPVGANPVLAAQDSFTGEIPPGLYFEQSLTVLLPSVPGSYYVVVQADANNEILELRKDNNVTVSPMPLVVTAAYEATVAAGIHSAPVGTPIPFSGTAYVPGTRIPPPLDSPVSIHIHANGTDRVISALTDASGSFATTWIPLPGEAGLYTIGAAFPGDPDAPAQDSFTLVGFQATPSTDDVSLLEGSPVTNVVTLQNGSPVPLSGLTVTILDKPSNLNIAFGAIADLAGSGTESISYVLTAEDASVLQGIVHIQINTSQGATALYTLNVQVNPFRPMLIADPSQLLASMTRGSQTIVSFNIANLGSTNTGLLTVLIPGAPWLTLISSNQIPPLPPGATNSITLQLLPDTTLPLGDYPGTLVISDGANSLSEPFNFRAVSSAVGSVQVTAVDEFTFYAVGNPNVTNATVVITDATTGTVITNGVTGADGTFFVPRTTEGYYKLNVSADQHTSYSDTLLFVAGQTNFVSAFLSRQAVTYKWTVVPTQVQDTTKITVDTTFATEVPEPVITVDPSVIDLSQVQGVQTQINLTIANHGLIAAQNFRLQFGTHPDWSISPLISSVGALPAKSSLTIPLIVKHLNPSSAAKPRRLGGGPDPGPCTISGGGFWDLLCGTLKTYEAPITAINASQNCGGLPGIVFRPFGPPSGGPGGGGGGTNAIVSGPVFSPPTICDCSLLPKLCLGGSIGFSLDSVAKQITSMILSKLPDFRVTKSDISFKLSGQICTCCVGNTPSIEGDITGTADVKLVVEGGPGLTKDLKFDEAPGWQDISLSLNALLGVRATLTGSLECSLKRPCGQEPKFCMSGSVGLQVFAGADASGSVSATEVGTGIEYSGDVSGSVGLNGSLSASADGCSDGEVKFTACGSLVANCHLNGSLEAKLGPITQSKEISLGGDTTLASFGACGAVKARREDGGTNLVESIDGSSMLRPDQEVLAALEGSTPVPQSGVCAKVKLELDQQAVLSRDAFKATLEIDNTSGTALQSIGVNIIIRDSIGNVVSNLFAYAPPSLNGLSAVDGTGGLPNGTTGTATWILLPTVDAAPSGPVLYSVGGTLSYNQGGTMVTLPLADAPITVYPLPQLTLDYFLQRDVYADDPFTPQIEPSIPFALGVLVRNHGAGTAHNFHVLSAQPKIVENDRGLLIDFKIIASEVAGQNLTPSLTLNFGDILPDSSKVGTWLMTSTLQGFFLDYSATFQSLDDLGNKRLDLVTNVTIHRMIHLVQAQGTLDDGLPDFLVDDVVNPRNLPDTVYLSDGTTNPVGVVEGATLDAPPSRTHLTVHLTAPMLAGWTYLRIPDPGNGQFTLYKVVRSDGLSIFVNTNIWTTDRTFTQPGERPIYENILHLLDYNSPGTYTLYYSPPPATDTSPPTSAVSPLPTTSPATFQVNWLGADNLGGSGVAFFDIYAATNGGPAGAWLLNTTLNSALFQGTPGATYSFYSTATDNAGNREAPHVSADAFTTVVSPAPVITAGADSLGTSEGNSVNAPIAKLLANDQDSMSFALRISAVSATSTNGGSVILGPNFITYTPAAGFFGRDQFTYTVVDDHGGQATGTVMVTVTAGSNASLNVISITIDGNTRVLRFAGIPGRSYVIQSAPDLNGNWTDISGPLLADPTGLLQFIDSSTGVGTGRFYRTYAP
jgi:hypothetical protein